MYKLHADTFNNLTVCSVQNMPEKVWHKKLGHPSTSVL